MVTPPLSPLLIHDLPQRNTLSTLDLKYLPPPTDNKQSPTSLSQLLSDNYDHSLDIKSQSAQLDTNTGTLVTQLATHRRLRRFIPHDLWTQFQEVCRPHFRSYSLASN